MSRLKNMQSEGQHVGSSVVSSIPNSIDDVFDKIESELLYERGDNIQITGVTEVIPLKKHYQIAHLLGNIFTIFGLASTRLSSKLSDTDKDLSTFEKVLSLSSMYETNRTEFCDEQIDSKTYYSRLIDIKDIIEKNADILGQELDDLCLGPSTSCFNKSLYRLEKTIGVVNHFEKSDSAFTMITSIYDTLQKDTEDPLINRLIYSFDDFEEISEGHYKSKLSGEYNFHIHDIGGSYLVTEENREKGIYSLYIVDSKGEIDEEKHKDEFELDKARRNNLLYFNKNPIMGKNLEEYRDMLFFLGQTEIDEERIPLDEITIDSIKKHKYEGQNIHEMDLSHGERKLKVYRNGSSDSVKVCVTPENNNSENQLLNYINSTLMH